jgi:excinuclease ABC subunit B
MYADNTTRSMKMAIDTTTSRRKLQQAYNDEHGITPAGIQKALSERMQAEEAAETGDIKPLNIKEIPKGERQHLIKDLTSQMNLASENLQFEKAALLRDQIEELRVATKPKKVRRS